jgi:hypothetical protein
MGSPKHVIDGVLVTGTDSEWEVADYKAKIATLPVPGSRLRAGTVAAALAMGVAALMLAMKSRG